MLYMHSPLKMSADVKEKMAYISRAVSEANYRYTVHGAQQRIARRLKRKQIEQVLVGG